MELAFKILFEGPGPCYPLPQGPWLWNQIHQEKFSWDSQNDVNPCRSHQIEDLLAFKTEGLTQQMDHSD